MLVDTEAFNGTYTSNPYNFKYHNLTQATVCVDGEQIPRKLLFLKFDEAGGQNFIVGFQRLFSRSGKLSQDAGNQINGSECGSGYTALCFDLSPDHCSVDHFELINKATFAWSFILPEHWPTQFIYTEFQNVIEIDAN